MRQWRVGSFSMGLILIFLGAGLVAGHFGEPSKVLEVALTWWPLALILLGLEILAAGFLSRNDQFKFKYDGWSIVLVALLYLFSLGHCALAGSGLLPQIREALAASEYSCTIPELETSLTGINKVIISSRGGDLELHSVTGNKLTLVGQAEIPAVTVEAAEKLAGQARPDLKRIGDTLFIQINPVCGKSNLFGQGPSHCGWAIFVPAAVSLELTGSGHEGQTAISLDSLRAPWSIDTETPVRVALSSSLDLTLYGSVSGSRENLSGNASWACPPEKKGDDNGRLQKFTGEIKLGQGHSPLVINSGEWIEANLRPAP